MFAPAFAQAGVAAAASVIAPTLTGVWHAAGCAGFDPVQVS